MYTSLSFVFAPPASAGLPDWHKNRLNLDEKSAPSSLPLMCPDLSRIARSFSPSSLMKTLAQTRCARRVVTKTRNDPQRLTTIHNDPTTIHNDPTTNEKDPTSLVKSCIFHCFCPIFDNLMNMLSDYQRYSEWLWVIIFAIVFQF